MTEALNSPTNIPGASDYRGAQQYSKTNVDVNSMVPKSHQGTSEYRGGQNYDNTESNLTTAQRVETILDIAKTSTQQHDLPSTRSYSQATKTKPTIPVPSRDQAIILNVVDELSLCDYLLSLADIVGPKNITFASRISNNRICVFLTSKLLVDRILQERSSINVKGHEIGIRRLITPAQRIIISNVCPSVPPEILENALKSAGLKLVSPVNYLRAGVPNDILSHVISFRRHVYITPPEDNEPDLPNSLVITHNNTSFRIFLTTDELKCFLCKQVNHIAKNCPTANTTTLMDTTSNIPSQTPNEQTNTRMETVHNDRTNLTPRTKRPAPESLSSNTNDEVPNNSATDPNSQQFLTPSPPTAIPHSSRPKQKKPKTESSAEQPISDETLYPVRKLIEENPTNFILPYHSFKCFLENSSGSKDLLAEANRFTNDIDALLSMLYQTYPVLTNRGLKSKFTRIQNKLKKCINQDSDQISLKSTSSLDSLSELDGSQQFY